MSEQGSFVIPGTSTRVTYQAALLALVAIIGVVALSGGKGRAPEPDEREITQKLLDAEISRIINEIKLAGLRVPDPTTKKAAWPSPFLPDRYWRQIQPGTGGIPITPHWGIALP